MVKAKGFLDGYRIYDPHKEGYGSPDDWRDAFGRRMGIDEANAVLGSDDPWVVLEIKPGATGDEIKRAWRRQAMKWHPDQHDGCEDAVEKFKRAKAAHVKLGEP